MVVVWHRVNKIEELKQVPENHGVEIDVRSYGSKLLLHHDPISDPSNCDDLEEYLKHVGKRFIVFNTKEVGHEERIIALAKKYGVENYFLLDVEFPFIFRAAHGGEYGLKLVEGLDSRVAIRYSEAEPIQQALSFPLGTFKWVWVDTNTLLPLNRRIVQRLRAHGYKLALVCPERWGRPQDISKYISKLRKIEVKLDAVMTGRKYVEQWEKSGVVEV